MVTIEDIEKLGALSRIALSDEEKKSLVGDIDAILAYVGQIQSASVVSQSSPSQLINVMRSDENPHESEIFTELILKSAPNRQDNYIKVKKILPS